MQAAFGLANGDDGDGVDDQIKQQKIERVLFANQNAQPALIGPDRTITPPNAKIATPEKVTEALLLRVMI